MATAFVQSKKAQGPPGASISSYTVAFDANVTAGNLIAVFTAWGVSGRTVTITDSLGNTYTQVDNDSGSNTWSFYAKNIAGGGLHGHSESFWSPGKWLPHSGGSRG